MCLRLFHRFQALRYSVDDFIRFLDGIFSLDSFRQLVTIRQL